MKSGVDGDGGGKSPLAGRYCGARGFWYFAARSAGKLIKPGAALRYRWS
jgi:hypothetical protein